MREPEALISTEQLAAVLGRPDLRVYDCTTYLEPPPPGNDEPYIAVSGVRTFEERHVPGADFLDLQGEFSDQRTRLRFMMPATAQLGAAFGRHGLGPGTRVVLYSIGTMMWATRFWWMLRSLGFDDAALAEPLEQALRHLVGAVVVTDLLAHDEHVGVALHLLAHRLVERLAVADHRHRVTP